MKIKLFFIIIVTFFSVSCQKEVNVLNVESQTLKFNVLEAQEFYSDELKILNQIQTTEKKLNLKIDYKVDWETYKPYNINDSTEIITVRLASYSKSILGNYGKSFLLFKKVKNKITGNIINVQSNLNGFNYFGAFDLSGNFLSGLKTEHSNFVATFDYQLINDKQKVMSDQLVKVNSCQTATVSVVLNGIFYTHTEYHCTPDNPNYFLAIPGYGGGSIGNMINYADYLNSINEAITIANTPTESVEINWNNEIYLFDEIDEKDPALGKNLSKVNFKIQTPNGSVITEWTDNQGRKHVHLNLKVQNIPSSVVDAFKNLYINQAGFAQTLWDSIKQGKFVFPDPFFLVYGTWANLIMLELDHYYQYKKNNP